MCCMMHAMDHSTRTDPGAQASATQTQSLLDTLKHRYALGEITREQFDEMKRVLGVADLTAVAEHEHHT